MTVIPTSSVPRFRATFILGVTNTMTLTDLLTTGYATYGTPTKALFSVSDPDGLIIYQNTGYAAASFTSPDFNSASSLWAVTGIVLPLDANGVIVKRGTYTFNALYSIAGTVVLVTKTYELKYVSPVVEINLSANCRTSELTSTDSTDYTNLGQDTIPLTTTLSRVHTVTKPAGSSANAPGSTTTTTITDTRVIGGGITAATRLWTRVWQTNIVTTLQYDLALWGIYTWVVVQDVVSGDDSIDVQCSNCACVLNTCWENLIIRWKDAEENYAINVNDLRYKIALGAALWTDFYNLERCGEDTSYKCLEIRDLLNSADCSCVGDDDTTSHVIVPWGAGAGSSSPSTFAFTRSASNPTPGSGNAGDKHINSATWHLWDNVSGTWIDVGSIQGTAGNDGAAGSAQVMFYNNSPNVGTSAGTSLELLDSILLATPILYVPGDCIYVKGVFEFGLNDHGKTASIYLNGTSIASHFSDTEINATNKIVTIEAWVNIMDTNDQRIDTLVTRGGNCYPDYTTLTLTTASGVTVKAYGQNAVATVNDIICRLLKVEVKNYIVQL